MCGGNPEAVWYRAGVVRINNNNSYHLFMINEIPIQQPL